MTGFIRNKKLLFWSIFLVGIFLRLIGIDYGLPYVYYPDEVRQILDTLSMAQRTSLIPANFYYSALHKYVLFLLYGVYYVIGRLIGLFHSSTEFALAFLQNPSVLFLIGRLLSVILGIGVGLIIYKIGKTVFGQKSAAIATIFSLFMYQLIGHSQWAIADIMVTFLTTMAFLCIFLDITFFRNRYFYLACIFVGLCISTKFQGMFIVPSIVIGQIYLMYEKKTGFNMFLKRFTIGAILILLFSVLGNIALFTDTTAYIAKNKALWGVSRIGLSSAPTYSNGFLGLLLWFSKQMVKQELILGIFILLGVVHSLWRHDKYDIICLSYLFLFFFILRNNGFRYLHLFTAAFGVMCLLAGRFVSDFLDKARSRKTRTIFYGLIITAIVLSVWRGVDAGLRKMHEDTRILAKNWIEKNIPTGSRIGIDWYVFGPPIFDDIPIVVHSPSAAKFYRNNVPLVIKSEYDRFLNEAPSMIKYNVINLMYVTPEPIWPEEMPEEARKRAEKIEVFREVYSWFNFMSPAEIEQLQIEYVIFSSYAYSHFLLDDDKRKTGLFNPYIFEDTLSNNRQAESYDGKSLNGLLFFLSKRARNFYLGFLNGGTGVRLIKEFVPGPRNLGPTIKIYKLEN